MMSKALRLILFFLLISIKLANAQACAPGDDACEPDATPLDGGVSLLIGAAALYGAKKLRKKK